MKHLFLLFGIFFISVSCSSLVKDHSGSSVITKWQNDKKSAISITYDDGTINQFTVARPIMNTLGMPGTFYILTGKIRGSARGKFIGRPINEIIKESATIKTSEANFFERASAIGFTGSTEAMGYHSQAGSLFESGELVEAYELIDKGYEKLRNGELIVSEEINYHENTIDTTTWDDMKAYGQEGHEIASHTITHPRLAVLDEANMLYELKQSKADIQKFLGDAYTFSAECPYGTEDERVMEYALDIYPALRNRMPESYLEELNRSSKMQPGSSNKEYVQWQRGPLTNISMDKMKSWVDTCLVHDNIWLVLVFHGIDGIGWEPRTGEELEEYFMYMKEKEENLWVATFADVTKYLRERKNTVLSSELNDNQIDINVSCSLDPIVYDVPITLKTYVPEAWETATLHNNENPDDKQTLNVQKDAKGSYVLYSVLPYERQLSLSKQS